MRNKVNIVATLLTIFLFSGCATYYQQSAQFQQNFAQGNLEGARAFLEKNKKAEEKKDRLLYFLDRGVVEQMLGNFEQSNLYFEKAYIYNQDYKRSFGNDLVGFIANPMLRPYQAEDFEVVLIHYYKTINYLQLNQPDEALVEIRRVNIALNELNDRYIEKKNRYKEDAFAHTLMGIIYEEKGDVNNAFIAYRNAYNIYSSSYAEEFQVGVPEQLKKDLIRTAKLNGFYNEQNQYEKLFGMKYEAPPRETSDLIFFWLNGLGPVKSEFSLNLAATKGVGGGFIFANEQEGFLIPYNQNQSYYTSDPAQFSDLKVLRMAIPHYLTREPLITKAFIEINGERLPLEKAEDVNKIAFSTLQDRMAREVAKSVGRLAIKQATELAARSENQDLGAVIGLLNAATEKADTRNWQTLPHSIYYKRVSLSPEEHTIKLVTSGSKVSSDTVRIKVDMSDGKTKFKTFHSLESTTPFKQ